MAPVPQERAASLPPPSAQSSAAAPSAAPASTASDAKGDAELFGAAQLASAHGDKDGARAAFIELIKKWPSSRYVAEAYVALGDLSFEAADPARMKEAEQEYLEAVKFPPPDNRVYGYAWYKLAFVYWNRGEGSPSLAAFKKVIDYGAQHPQDANAAKLRIEAMRDVVPVFAQVGNPTRAYPFFRLLAGDDPGALTMMESLAKAYATSGKLPEAKSAYQDLAVRDAPHACVHGVHARFSVSGANQAVEDAELKKCP